SSRSKSFTWPPSLDRHDPGAVLDAEGTLSHHGLTTREPLRDLGHRLGAPADRDRPRTCEPVFLHHEHLETIAFRHQRLDRNGHRSAPDGDDDPAEHGLADAERTRR